MLNSIVKGPLINFIGELEGLGKDGADCQLLTSITLVQCAPKPVTRNYLGKIT